MTQNKCQQEFEKWATENKLCLEQSTLGTDYVHYGTHYAYLGWCAAWESAQEQLITARNIYMLGYERGEKDVNK